MVQQSLLSYSGFWVKGYAEHSNLQYVQSLKHDCAVTADTECLRCQ